MIQEARKAILDRNNSAFDPKIDSVKQPESHLNLPPDHIFCCVHSKRQLKSVLRMSRKHTARDATVSEAIV